MSAHSPAPWSMQKRDKFYFIDAQVPEPENGNVATVWNRLANAEANARLIAAAPDLLVAINECRKQINSIIEDGAPTDWRMWRDDLDALIAKAEGRS